MSGQVQDPAPTRLNGASKRPGCATGLSPTHGACGNSRPGARAGLRCRWNTRTRTGSFPSKPRGLPLPAPLHRPGRPQAYIVATQRNGMWHNAPALPGQDQPFPNQNFNGGPTTARHQDRPCVHSAPRSRGFGWLRRAAARDGQRRTRPRTAQTTGKTSSA
jgi:hypothetical protein